MGAPRTSQTFAPPVGGTPLVERRYSRRIGHLSTSVRGPVDPPPAPLLGNAKPLPKRTRTLGRYLGFQLCVQKLPNNGVRRMPGRSHPNRLVLPLGAIRHFQRQLQRSAAVINVILPTPFYFNHKMWLDMAGVDCIALDRDSLLPDVEAARALITPATRAIALVTPNNPGGVEYPSELVGAFFDLCQEHGLALIVDETYRDFHAQTGAPHDLFARPQWDETLIQLYSFSKAYRLTGHRVGSVVTSTERQAEIEKFFDTKHMPQSAWPKAALWGMQNLVNGLYSEEPRPPRCDFRVLSADGRCRLGATRRWRLFCLCPAS